MFAKVNEDLTEEMKDKLMQEMSNFQTVAHSTPSVGPFNVVEGTIFSSQDWAMHLPGYDAPRDPQPEGMSRSFPASAAVACDAPLLLLNIPLGTS